MITLPLLFLLSADIPANIFDPESKAGNFPVRTSEVALLTGGEDSLAARLATLKSAKKSVRIQALIFTGDEVGLHVSDLLKQKKKEGLDVRVIVDATSNLSWPTQWMYFDLKQHGIEVEGYETFYLHALGEEYRKDDPLRMNKRYHDKLWVIDGEDPHGVAIIGGRNIANEYFRISDEPIQKWRDQDVYLRGPIVEDTVKCFDSNYEYLKGIKAKLPKEINPDNSWKLTNRLLAKIGKVKVPTWIREKHAQWVKKVSERSMEYSVFPAPMRFVQSRPRFEERFIENAYYSMIAGSKETINIANAYFVPSKELIAALKTAAQRGVKIRIITNSPETNDIKQIAVLSRWLYAPLLEEPNIEIYEWIGPKIGEGTLHAKHAIFDGVRSIIGSYNLDPRSARLNSETMIAVDDKKFSAELDRIFREEDLPKAKSITHAVAKKFRRPSKLDDTFQLLFALPMREWL